MKYLFLITIIFVFTVFGQSRIDTSNISLVLKIYLQKDTVCLGEPLILTSTLINKSSKPIVIRAEPADGFQEIGLVGQTLVDPSGKSQGYRIGIHASSLWPLLKMQKKSLPPGDSIYWRKLLWLENFDPSVNLEDFALGQYQIIGKYYHEFDDESMHIRQKIFCDSISFVLAYQSNLIVAIKPIRSELKNLFWYDGIAIDAIEKNNKVIVSRTARAENFFKHLLKIRNLDTPFTIYADYLLPAIAEKTKKREKEALTMAEEFMKKYASSPLGEEMAFCRGKLLEKAGRETEMNEWLKPIFKRYPKNAFRFAFELGRNLNESEK
jgi:hypothetical protein